jgi:hypothetical protein
LQIAARSRGVTTVRNGNAMAQIFPPPGLDDLDNGSHAAFRRPTDAQRRRRWTPSRIFGGG